MDGETLYELTTQLLGGEVMNETLFYQLLNVARKKREAARDWMQMRQKDTSLSWLTTDSIDVAKSLPSNFLRPLKATAKTTPIVFLDPATGRKAGSAVEIPAEQQYDYQDVAGYFFVDYYNAALSFTAAAPQAYTAALFFIGSGPDITEDSSWNYFDAAWSPILAYDVANAFKGGIDFDEINARMVQYAGMDAEALFTAMVMDDDRKRLSVLGV